MTEDRILEVHCRGRLVGKLAEMPDRRIAFQYSGDWLRNGFSISPLSLPLKGEVFIPRETTRGFFRGLFGIFADSLPDSWGELLLDRYLESIGIRPGDLSVLDRLAYVGRSGMGALEYFPAKEADFDVRTAGLDYDRVAGECEKLLESKPSDQLDLLYRIAGSSGGTRPKIMLSEGGRDWIVKFPAGNDPADSGKREYMYSVCARECGIVMTETGLIPSSVCDGYFKTARFDRERGEKRFSATFCGLLEADYRAPSCDYETFMKLIRVLTRDNASEKQQMFRIMCFNVYAHNRDDHAKNFSMLYTEEGWRLAPAYDLTYSDTYWGEQTTSVNGKGREIREVDLMKVGRDAGLSEKFCRECIREIFEKTRALREFANPAGQKKRKRISLKKRLSELG